MRNRERFPDFTAAVDVLRGVWGAKNVRVIGVVNTSGDEAGNVDEAMRANLRKVAA